MIGKLARQGRIIALIPGLIKDDNPYDVITTDKHGLFDKTNETGWERLRNLFRKHEGSQFHPALINVFHTSVGTFIMGAVYGAVITSRKTFIEFIEKNEATKFLNHLEAKRMLSDKMFTSFVKGGTRWGIRISFFCTSFMVAYTAVSVYRNKDSFWYYSFGGMYAGAIYKFPLGPKGMISGAVFGGLFGTLYAGIKLLLLKAAGLTEDQLRERVYQNTVERDEAIKGVERRLYMEETKKEMAVIMNEPTKALR